MSALNTSGRLMPPPSGAPPGPGPSTSSSSGASTSHLLASISSSQAAAAAGSSSGSQAPSLLGAMNDDDQRFAELLRPIKDLTQNWEVPLSRYLEDYIDELQELHIQLDGRTQRVNFAEAALLLQGTVSVYSKKVEFLWQNVLKMLDLLASRKALEEDAAPDGPGGRRSRKKGGMHDVNDFSLVAVELCKSTNMKHETVSVGLPSDRVKDRKAALNFITVTPRQLIEKEGKEVKSVRVNVFTREVRVTRDLIGHKEDFRVNAQYLMATATVGEELSTEQELGEQSVSLCEDETSIFLQTSLLQPNQLSPEKDKTAPAVAPEEEAAPSVVPDDFVNDNVDDHHFGDDGPLPDTASDQLPPTLEEDEENSRPKRRRDKFQEILDEPKAPLADKWEPVKPHEAANVKPRPVKRGRTCRAPPVSSAKLAQLNKKPRRNRMQERLDANVDAASTSSTSSSSRLCVVCPIEQHLIMDHSYASSLTKGRMIEEEFLDVAHEETKERKKAKESMAENLPPTTVAREPVAAEDYSNEGDGDGGGGWEDFEADGGDAFAGQDDDDPLPDPHANDMQVLGSMFDDAAAVPGSSKDAAAEKEEGDSYEELVMKRVAAYVQQSQEYIESTDLAKKVSRWHLEIGPRLERVEQRSAFDVHEYGTSILSKFPESDSQSNESGSDAPCSKSRKTTTSFSDVVAGKDQEEICRYFLSSLMLANTYNIELANSNSSPKTPGDSSPQNPGDSAGPSNPKSSPRKKNREQQEVQITVINSDPASLPMDDIEMRLLSTRRVYCELYEDPDPTPQPGTSKNREPQKTGNREAKKGPQQRPKKGGGKAKNRPTLASAADQPDRPASRSPSKRPLATETDDAAAVVVNGLPAVEH